MSSDKRSSISLAASFFVSLCLGTPYLYGVYGPQFVRNVGLSASDSALLSLATNIGLGIGGLPAGLFIDQYGPQWLIVLGLLATLFGFSGLYSVYTNKWLVLLVMCTFMASNGFGLLILYFASLKAAQANFPNHRGAAGAVPASAYGLSAMVFLFVAAVFFANNTGGLLLFVAVACGSVMFLGSWFVHVYEDEEALIIESRVVPSPRRTPTTSLYEVDPRKGSPREEDTRLLGHRPSQSSLMEPLHRVRRTVLVGLLLFWGIGSRSSFSSTLSSPIVTSPLGTIVERLTDVHFLTHYVLLSLLSGIGQMYIYCVGFVVIAQYHTGNQTAPVSAIQALQVSLISIGSFSGRLSLGFVSDFFYKTLGIHRLWLIFITAVLLLAGQLSLVLNENNIHLISLSSVMIGTSFGSVFGNYPAIIADVFGTRTFSTTWGLICTGPLTVIYLLNRYFGHVYDSHVDNDGICKGNVCYKQAFELSAGLTVLTMGLCLVLVFWERLRGVQGTTLR